MFCFSNVKKYFSKMTYRISHNILKRISDPKFLYNRHFKIVSEPSHQQIQV